MLNISTPKLSINDRLLKALDTKTVQYVDEPREKRQLANLSPYFPRVSTDIYKCTVFAN